MRNGLTRRQSQRRELSRRVLPKVLRNEEVESSSECGTRRASSRRGSSLTLAKTEMPSETPKVEFRQVSHADLEVLADLRVAAMRESLERVGRFDPVRARERLRSTFSAEHTRFIIFEGEKIGFYAARPSTEGLRLDHLYVHPKYQSRGIGSEVLRSICAEAGEGGVAVLVGALKESDSNRFYQRHGFAMVGEGEWDNYYLRPIPSNAKSG